MAETALKVLVCGTSVPRGATLVAGLRDAGIDDVAVLDDPAALGERNEAAAPDVVLVDLGRPAPELLDRMFALARRVRRPLAMFVDEADADAIARAVECGVAAYVVDGLRRERVRAIVDTALSRFRATDRLERALDETRRQLADRKAIDRAKALLIARHGLTENAAYALLRKAAMDAHRPMGEVARALVAAADARPAAEAPGRAGGRRD
jgi:two-component system, response regulator / RNA-binding antiterminator